MACVFFSSRRRHTRCALVTGVQTCALPISRMPRSRRSLSSHVSEAVMARGVNKVILIGNLGKDPEVRYFPSGDAIANATIATTEGWKDKQTGEQKEMTEWPNVVFPGKLGEIAGDRKGVG